MVERERERQTERERGGGEVSSGRAIIVRAYNKHKR